MSEKNIILHWSRGYHEIFQNSIFLAYVPKKNISIQWRTYHRTKGSVSPQIFEKKYSEKSYSLAQSDHKPIRMFFSLLFPSILYLQLIMHLNDKIHNCIYFPFLSCAHFLFLSCSLLKRTSVKTHKLVLYAHSSPDL